MLTNEELGFLQAWIPKTVNILEVAKKPNFNVDMEILLYWADWAEDHGQLLKSKNLRWLYDNHKHPSHTSEYGWGIWPLSPEYNSADCIAPYLLNIHAVRRQMGKVELSLKDFMDVFLSTPLYLPENANTDL